MVYLIYYTHVSYNSLTEHVFLVVRVSKQAIISKRSEHENLCTCVCQTMGQPDSQRGSTNMGLLHDISTGWNIALAKLTKYKVILFVQDIYRSPKFVWPLLLSSLSEEVKAGHNRQ